MARKVIIDCDVGVDDALALILAFHSPELHVEAVTGVNGNVSLPQVFENIQKVLSLIQPSYKPLIAKGAGEPIRGKAVYSHSVHGEDGLGGALIDRKEGEKWWQTFPRSTDELITEMARSYPDEIGVIAIGPLTNLALAIQKDPEGIKKLKEVVIMGGSVRTKGNITPYAEFNVFTDPLAAKLVFQTGLPMTLVPLDVTHRVFLTTHTIEERVRPLHHRFSRFIMEATGYDLAAHRFRKGEVKYLHDPLAVGVVIEPDLVKKERLLIDVETKEGEHYGQIREVPEKAGAGSKIDVCLEVKSERFLDLFLSRLNP